MKADEPVFTNPDVWTGGSYQLCIETSGSDHLRSLLRAIWSCPTLHGCYRRRDIEPTNQPKVEPELSDISGHLYGVATLPNGRVVACRTYVCDYDGDADDAALHSLSFGIEMGALAQAYPVGAYPFGSMAGVADWKDEVESFFVSVATQAHKMAPFTSALIGFEVDPSALASLTNSAAVPAERDFGCLVHRESGLLWYPATRA